MIFLSLIIINFYLLSLSASVLPQTDNPTAAHQMLREGVFNPLPRGGGGGGGGNGSVAFVSFEG